ncbi:MAG: KEOPS complex subunit Pcc1 [Candidatus Methanofastidiosia archaeon]
MHKLKIEVTHPKTKLIYKALKTEIESAPYEKTVTEMKRDRKKLIIEIQSEDLKAIRGTFNSYMNWLRVSLEGLDI